MISAGPLEITPVSQTYMYAELLTYIVTDREEGGEEEHRGFVV